MIDRQEVLEFAGEVGLDPNVVEKDYVLGWMLAGISRHPRTRDMYDVIHLHRHDTGADRAAVLEVLKAKCEFKGIAVPTLDSLSGSPHHAELRADWEQMLAHQLPQLPPFDAFWNELPTVFDWLQHEPAKAQPPAMGPGRSEIDQTWRAPAMASSWRAQGITAPLEIVRFAAANRLCIDLDYQDDKGRVATRTIEPYSLRRTKAGDLLLYAVRSRDGQDRSYRVDRIRGARATQQAFIPRYAVELSATGPIHAPETARAKVTQTA